MLCGYTKRKDIHKVVMIGGRPDFTIPYIWQGLGLGQGSDMSKVYPEECRM